MPGSAAPAFRETRAQAHRFYREVMDAAKAGAQAKGEDPEPAQAGAMAELGRKDLFYLLVYLLNRKDVDRDWLFDRCREVQADPDGHLDLWARDHYKSTIITFALTIQDVLNDPEITIGIFSHTRPISKGFLRQIKEELERNEVLKALYADVLWAEPKRQSPKWSENDGITVIRQGNPKEATIEAWGLVDAQPTSKHFRLRIYDDIVTDQSITTPDMIKKTTDSWALSQNLGTEGGRARCIGTRFHLNDTYAEMIRRGSVVERRHPATKNGQMGGEPVFLGREELAKKRRDMGPYVFGCQMLLNPVADRVQGFKQEWLDYWQVKESALRSMNLYITVDPASEKKTTSDFSVFMVVGLGADGNYYVVDMVRDRLNLTERAATLFRLHRQYRPLAVGYEKYGIQADIEHIEDKQKELHYRFSITPLGGSTPKNDRIRRLIPKFENNKIFLPHRLIFVDHEKRARDLTQEFVDHEYEGFPVGAHDDMLDCLARILDADLKTRFPDPTPQSDEPEFTTSAAPAHAPRRRPQVLPAEHAA